MMESTYITNIVICYANEDEIIEYAKQVAKQTMAEKIKLIVVVNMEQKGITYLKVKLSQIGITYKIINPQKNLGYLNGLLCGYEQDKLYSKWYILSNTDIEIPDKNTVEKFLKRKYLNDSEIWVVGPSVFAPKKGSFSNPYMIVRPSKKIYIIKNSMMNFPYIYNTLFKIKEKLKKITIATPRQSNYVYAVHGSFMFIKQELLNCLVEQGKWELLYDEEQYIAETVLRYGKKIYYDSDIQINHMEGMSTGKVNIRTRYSLMRKANKRIIEGYY